ncbi:hypothetical protein Srufu_069410 [Streptomyces libani subsp. rufus]|nr:hypothetical protein Srufu_069410 [Streptomyces libani subsp. rufus]
MHNARQPLPTPASQSRNPQPRAHPLKAIQGYLSREPGAYFAPPSEPPGQELHLPEFLSAGLPVSLRAGPAPRPQDYGPAAIRGDILEREVPPL